MPEQNLDELKQWLEQAETPSEFRRVQCVYLREQYGYSSQKIAEMTSYHPATVRRIQSEYRKYGMAALSPKPKGGRYHQNLSFEDEQVFVAKLGIEAEDGQLPDISEIQLAYEEKVGRPVGKSTVYALLRRHHWRKVVARP